MGTVRRMENLDQYKPRFEKRSRWLLVGVVTVIIAGIGLGYWLDNGRTNYAIARNHYQEGNCEVALGIYSWLAVYPAFLADFADAAQREWAECDAFALATAAFAADDAKSIKLLEAFVVDHRTSPLQQYALDRLAENYLALELKLRTDAYFPRTLSTYAQLAKAFPDLQAYTDEKQLAAYLDYGSILRERQDYAAAVDVYSELLAEDALLLDDEVLRADVTTLLVESYVGWNRVLRDMDDYAAAVAALDELSTVVPNTEEQVSELVIETILKQADWLGDKEDYAAAVDALDTLAERGGPQRLAAIESRNEALLAWGRVLRDEGRYGQAVDAFRRILAEEHARLAPLTSGTFETELPWPFPYGVVAVANAQTQIRLGPGDAYQEIGDREQRMIRAISAVLGVSPNGEWIALTRPPQLNSESLADANALSEIDWSQDRDQPIPIYWTSIDGVVSHLTGTHTVPLEPRLLEQLVAQSPQSEQAVAEIRVTYPIWSDEAEATGDYAQAADNLIALQALGTSLEERETHLAQLAELYLQRAGDSIAEGNYQESIAYAGLVIDYDYDGTVTSSAQQLIAAAKLSLGIQRQEEGDWPGAVHYFEEILQMPAASSSSAAAQRLAEVRQTWGNEHYENGAYDEALDQYAFVLNNRALSTVISGTEELAAQARTDWALSLWPDNMSDVVTYLEAAIALAPDSEPGATASAKLLEAMELIESRVAVGGACDEVAALDAFSTESLVNRASQILPKALFQCGQDEGEDSVSLMQAMDTYARLIEEFPASEYVAAARRELLVLSWKQTVYLRGPIYASRAACRNAADYVQAGIGSLISPPLVFVLSSSGYIIGEESNDATGITAVVCIDGEGSERIEVCYYTVYSPGDAILYLERSYVEARIVNPVTELTVAKGRVYGSAPNPCQQSEEFSPFSLSATRTGPGPGRTEFLAWIQRYIPALDD